MNKYLIIILFVISINLVSAAISDNIAFCYNFDDNLNDSTTNNNHLSMISGSATYAPGKLGNGTSFDNSKYMGNTSATSGISATGNFTACSWINITGNPASAVNAFWDVGDLNGVLQTNAHVMLYELSGSQQTVNYGNKDYRYDNPALNTWYYYCSVWYEHNDTNILYRDGTAQSQTGGTSGASGIDLLDKAIRVGGWTDGGVYKAQGVLDTFSFWNRALTTAEVSDLYNSGNGRNCSYVIPVPASTSSVTNITIQTPVYLNTNATVTWNFTNSTGGTGNQQSNVTWYKNAILLAVYTNITTSTHNLTEGNFTVNDQLTAEITPYDGSSSGTKLNSSTTTVLLYTNTSQTFQTPVLHGTKQNYNITLSTYFSNDITSFNSIIFNFNGTNYTGYNSSSSSPWILYTTNVQIPNITTTTTNINGTWYINASTNEGNFNFTFTNTTTVSLFGIDNCSVYTQRWVNFTIHDEVTGVTLHQNNLSAYFEYRDRLANYSNFYNISMNNRSNFSFCVIPQWANESVDMLIQYVSEGYDLRDFIVENYALDNVTEQTELYLLSTVLASAVTVHVTDQSDNDKVGVLVLVEKWNIALNNYETVEAEYTDSNGEAVVQLRLNSDYYRFTVYENGALALQTIKQKASGAIIPLIITSSGTNIVSEYLTTISAVTRTLTFTNTSNIVNLTYSHNNDNIANVCMRINDQNGTISNQCSSNTTGTILYTLTTRNNTHTAVAYVTTDTENTYIIATLDIPALRVWNTLGADKAIGFTLVLFLTLGLLGVGTTLQSKTGAYIALGMSWLGLFIPTVFGLLPIGGATMSGITVLFIIIAWVIERK